MSTTQPSNPGRNPNLENPRILAWAGGALFVLGLLATFLAFTEPDTASKVSMVLNAAVLLTFGYPMLLYVRALQKIAVLEQRINELEQRPRS